MDTLHFRLTFSAQRENEKLKVVKCGSSGDATRREDHERIGANCSAEDILSLNVRTDHMKYFVIYIIYLFHTVYEQTTYS